MLFSWERFWNYYGSVTENRNQAQVAIMERGLNEVWVQYWRKHCGVIDSLFIEDVFYGKGMGYIISLPRRR